MGAPQTAERIRELSAELRSCQGHVLGSLTAEKNLLEQRCRAAASARDGDAERRRRSVVARQGRAAALAKRRVNETVDALIGERDDGALAVAEYVQVGAIYLPTSGSPEHTVPLIVPLLGHGNVVLCARTPSAASRRDAAVRHIEMRALEKTAPHQLKIVSFDPLLSNLEAPFAQVDEMGEDALRYVQTSHELDVLLDKLTDFTTRVHNSHLVGERNVIARYRGLGMPLEPYVIVVLHDYPQQVSETQHQRILALSRSAPAAGVSFLLCPAVEREQPKWLDLAKLEEAEIFSVDERGRALWEGREQWATELYGVEAREAAEVSQRLRSRGSSLPEVLLSDLLPMRHFGYTSEDGISFPIGVEAGRPVEITLGSSDGQRHNALVTGAVGQGKSNLIKVIIYGLCARYAPEELSLYLLDFKEGVTLYPMAPTKESPEYLPQARVLGLEADQDFGIEVLRNLTGEMARRTMTIRPYGDSLWAYRRSSGQKMPRILLIIDEFQLLLEGERGGEAQGLLEHIVRLGRSAGIHVILASQSIGGISSLLGRESKFFAQFPVRVGLKNSPEESRATFGPLNDAAAHLRYRGQAIVNESYGDPAANRTVLVARADDDRLADLRDELYREVGPERLAPHVFDGSRLPTLGPDLRRSLADRHGSVPFALLGRSVRVEQTPTAFLFEDLPGRNVAIVGRGVSPELTDESVEADLGTSVFEAALLSLCLSSDDSIPLVLLDFGGAGRGNDANLELILRSCAREVERIGRNDFRPWVESLAKELDEGAVRRRWVVCASMDRAGSFDFSFQGQFQRVLQEGAAWGVHFFLWWTGATVLQSQLGLNGLAAFEGRVLLYGSQSIARQVVEPTSTWNGQSRRGLYCDSSSGAGATKLIPYAPLSAREVTRLLGGQHARA